MKMDGTMSTTADANPTNLPSSGIALPDDVLEKLYQSYSLKQRRSGLACFLAASILFDLWAILIPQGQSWESLGVTCIFLILNICLAIFLWLCGKSRFRGIVWEIAPFVAWLFAIKQLFLQLFLKGSVTPRDSLGWAILLNFLVYVALPVLLKYTGLLLGIGSFAIYINTIIGLAKKENYFWAQQIANILLISTAALIGLLCYFLGEVKQRRAFLEAKQSLEVKMIIEEQSAEQEQLLLSVLPEHVAVKMRQDLGSTNSEQFKKIYMSRHENVSILYADIVGFTAISSTYSAQDLVKILNELFARFDRLAEKYQQLRIKILGDCYYCISGAPVERPDHAVLCVHMGLSMVKAIKYVQQKTKSPVDMRVGIHTGAVLAGILGQRQWQFDVYSKDVELANKMESSGKAGRVHLSEKTLGFLNGEFEVEAAFGEKREELLRIAGLKTYFITKVIKPFVQADYQNGSATQDGKDVIEPDGPSEIFKEDEESKCTSPGGDVESNTDLEKSTNEEDYKTRLRKELVSRDGHGQLSKDINILLTFKDNNLENAYSSYREPYSSIPLCASLLVHIVGGIYSFLVLPRTILHFEIILMTMVIVVLLVFISIAENFPGVFPAFVILSSKKFNDCTWLRRIAGIVTIVLVGLSNSVDMFVSSLQTPTNLSIININLTSISIKDIDASSACLFPSYFTNFVVLILIAASIISQLSHLVKICIMTIITGIHCYINIFYMEEPFRNEEYHTWNNGVPLRYSLSALLIACTFALSGLARHMDKVDRVIFMWKTEVIDQKEKASDMRRRNEKLVYNVLPMHVAEHFMGNRKRQHDELYSQSYAEVGVLFASMPNFSDFYTEESVNNQGLECLRFLNEVISDYDALLELPQFQDIIKIKTIGSTYMAASGLNPARVVKPEESANVRWAHLALLVEFALELKKALQGINEQSFNHFVLKMGINHGPITAGVIGARKPHYDIWGNTVNVASRMESTGKAGAIQVTEETCEILQPFGYTFEQRGLVAVKGKGELMTYYLQGKIPKPNLPPSSPILACVSPMETVPEVDESKEFPSSPSPTTPPVNTISSDSASQQTTALDTEHLQQHQQTPNSGSPIPPLTSISSASTTSPNSVRLNQEYVEMHPNGVSTTILTTPIVNNLSVLDKAIESQQTQFNDIHKQATADLEADAKVPLLQDNDDSHSTIVNSTNKNFSIDEKDSLLDNEN